MTKPFEVIASRFEVSAESAKYFLGRVQKSFKTERPPHQLIVDFMSGLEFDLLPSPQSLAMMMKENGVWAYEMAVQPVIPPEDEAIDLNPQVLKRKIKNQGYRSKSEVCPHGVPLKQVCATCEFDTFTRLMNSE
ncbi:MAG: hypothetical protein U0Z26_09630 [Anaerolineales bacterium]